MIIDNYKLYVSDLKSICFNIILIIKLNNLWSYLSILIQLIYKIIILENIINKINFLKNFLFLKYVK